MLVTSTCMRLATCTLAYILCTLLSVAVILNVAGLPTHLWISIKLAWFGKWIPHDLGLAKDATLSRWNSGYFELMILLAIAFAIYGLCAIFLYRQAVNTRCARCFIWLGVLGSGSIYLFTPGILASDIYSYASYGRILAVHFSNPYFVAPSAFPHDPIYHILFWKQTVSTYGPVWTAISALLSLLAGTSLLSIIITFRLFAFTAHLLNIALVAATLRAMDRSTRIVTRGMLLYAWNPLVLMESSLGGHNDVLMVTFMLLGLWLCARAEQKTMIQPGAYMPPLVAFTLAALVKYSAIPLIAIFILALFVQTLQHHTGGQRTKIVAAACRNALAACCISVIIALTLYASFWIGHSIPAIIKSFISLPSAQQVFNSALFTIDSWNSAHLLPHSLEFLTERKLWNVMMIIAVVVPMLIGTLALWRTPTTSTIALVSLASLSASLLFTPWFFAWYITWLVGLAVICLPVLYDRVACALIAFTLTFSATTFATYYATLIGWSLLQSHPAHVGWTLWMCLATFGIPLLALLVFLMWPLTGNSCKKLPILANMEVEDDCSIFLNGQQK